MRVGHTAHIACTKVEELVAAIRAALATHDVARVAARVRRARNVAGLPAPSRYVTVSGAAEGGAGGVGAPPAATGWCRGSMLSLYLIVLLRRFIAYPSIFSS